MDEIFILKLIDILRNIVNIDSHAFAIFGQNLGINEDNSVDALFSDYFYAEEQLQFLLVEVILDQAGISDSVEEIELTDMILNRFFDDDVRSGYISSQELLDEFNEMAENYLFKEGEGENNEHV